MDILEKIPKQPQSQASLSEQLIELIKVANRLGLYDAADFIAKVNNSDVRNRYRK